MNKSFLVIISILCLAIQLNAQKKPEIDRSRFEVSTENVTFPEAGGKKTLTVKADNEWSIKSKPASWVTVSRSGNRLLLSAGKNTLATQRSTTVTITSKNKDIKITVTQSAASILEITPSSVQFGSEGGTKHFTVKATSEWSIGTGTKQWGHLERDGNTIILRVDANKQTTERTDHFTIKSGNRSVTISISQSAAKIKPQSITALSITPSSANFSSNGGSKTFTITSNKSWRIETGTASWGNLVKRGNNLILTVAPNNQETARSDWFTVKSGETTARVNISQAGASSKFEISDASANFSENGGTKTFTITTTGPWQIEKSTSSWGHLTKNNNSLTLKVDANTKLTPRTDFFTIKSGNKLLRVDISQLAAKPYLTVDGSSDKVSLNFSSYGSRKYITVNTNLDNYEIWGKPAWCQITNRNATGFYLRCNSNNSSYSRSDYMEVRSSGKTVRINIAQSCDIDKYYRRKNGGWINMAIGVEGGYGPKEGSWYSNGIVGMRIGNYRDLFQFELGVAPGVVSDYDSSVNFHLPAYASLKLSAKTGAFYFKMGGAYNLVRDKLSEGKYSLRAGFGSAWKHFEWDWAFIQLNASNDYYNTKNLFDSSNMMVGMRMAWYITR